MNEQRLREVQAKLRMVADDMAVDTAMREGTAFNGANVAAALGEISAGVAAIASALVIVIEEVLP